MSIVTKHSLVRNPSSSYLRGGPHWSDQVERVTRTTLKLYPSGHGCLVVRQVPSTLPNFQAPLSEEESRQRSLVRAQVNVKDRILSLGADRMLTLTYRSNMQDRPASREHLRAFMLAMKRVYPTFKCVACVERQQRGALHWHVAIRGWLDVNLGRRLWCEIIGEPEAGQFNITKRVRDPRHLFYVAKYIGKDMLEGERPRYGHHYVTSRGLAFDIEKRLLFNFNFAQAIDQARQLLSDEHGVTQPSSGFLERNQDGLWLQTAVMRW